MYYRGSDAAVLVYDITKVSVVRTFRGDLVWINWILRGIHTKPETFEELRGWAYELKNNGPPGRSIG